MDSDHYKLLGVQNNATPREIHAAYLRSALRHHPDLNRQADGRFKRIQRAYETLSDPHKRSQYDRDPKAWRTSSVVQARGRPSPPVEPGTVRPADPFDPTRVRYEALHQAASHRLYQRGILIAIFALACVAFVAHSGVPWMRKAPTVKNARTVKNAPNTTRPARSKPWIRRLEPSRADDQPTPRIEGVPHNAKFDQPAMRWSHDEEGEAPPSQDRDFPQSVAAASSLNMLENGHEPPQGPDAQLEFSDQITPSLASQTSWQTERPSAAGLPSMSFKTRVNSQTEMDAMDAELSELIQSLSAVTELSQVINNHDSPTWQSPPSHRSPAPQFPHATTQFPNATTQFPNAATQFPNAATQFPNAATLPPPSSITASLLLQNDTSLFQIDVGPHSSVEQVASPITTAHRPYTPPNPTRPGIGKPGTGKPGWRPPEPPQPVTFSSFDYGAALPAPTFPRRPAHSETIWTALAMPSAIASPVAKPRLPNRYPLPVEVLPDPPSHFPRRHKSSMELLFGIGSAPPPQGRN